MGMFWERLEAFGWSAWKRLGTFEYVQSVWDHMGAFGRLGRPGRLCKHNPVSIYGKYTSPDLPFLFFVNLFFFLFENYFNVLCLFSKLSACSVCIAASD